MIEILIYKRVTEKAVLLAVFLSDLLDDGMINGSILGAFQ